MKQLPALLALADGSVFTGISIGVSGENVGEVVFNTAMTGYQEILTDPSYAQQFITLTYPHIGNVGTNRADAEADKVWASGLIIRDLSAVASNWRSEQSLSDYLQQHQVIGIADIDTRRLTRLLREKGALNGCLQAGEVNAEQAIIKARAFAGLNNADLAKVVSTKKIYQWQEGTLGQVKVPAQFHVVAYDFGAKHAIFRLLVDHGCRVTVVPAQTTAEEALALKPDGIFLSTGPGDTASCDYAIRATEKFLEKGIPIFGICLGHQLLGLASGAKTVKMKFGHHGANHPVQDLQTKVVMITSQNHGFAVDEATLPANLKPTHRSLFDNTLQGFERTDVPAFAFQGHPEASPGPHEARELFAKFNRLMAQR